MSSTTSYTAPWTHHTSFPWPGVLEVEAPQGVARGPAPVVLHEVGGQPGRGEAGLVEGLQEEAPGVAVHPGLQHLEARQGCPAPSSPGPRAALQEAQQVPPVLFFSGCASCSSWASSMYFIRQAISSRQATLRPVRCSITWTNCEASISDSWVPVSSQAEPRLISSTRSCPAAGTRG